MDTKDIKFNTHRVDEPNEAGFARVSLDKPLFLDIAKFNTPYPYTTSIDLSGRALKIFQIGGYEIITGEKVVEGTHTGKDGKEYPNTETVCYMNHKDAKSIQTNLVDSREKIAVTI